MKQTHERLLRRLLSAPTAPFHEHAVIAEVRVSDEGIKALACAGVAAVLLPGTTLSLGGSSYAPARRLIDEGVPVALATDCNPGSSMTESMQIIVSLASMTLRMTPAEALSAATVNAAYACGVETLTGTLEIGNASFKLNAATAFLISATPEQIAMMQFTDFDIAGTALRIGPRRVRESEGGKAPLEATKSSISFSISASFSGSVPARFTCSPGSLFKLKR